MFIFICLVAADIIWHIWEYIERKRLDKCWDDVFNAKINSENRWHNLCSKYIDTINDLREENEKLKKGKNNDKTVAG